MSKNIFKSLLVIGDNHEELAKKYSLETKVEPYTYMWRDDAASLQKSDMKFLEKVITTRAHQFPSAYLDLFTCEYLKLKKMSDFDYFLLKTQGCTYDEETGDAFSDKNPDAHYSGEKCYQEEFITTGEEAPCANPFVLKDGTRSYSAKKDDIDWKRMHMYNTKTYEAAWELVVDDREATNEDELKLKESMQNRKAYFKNFENKEDYVLRSCAFYTQGVVTNKKYFEKDFKTTDGEWAKAYFNKFIKPLSDDTLLTIYEARNITEY